MLLDHIGVFLIPESIILRMFGRLAFPLFAWGIANGAHYSKNKYKYLLRIFAVALISQIPYFLLFRSSGATDVGPNILFTFSLALLVIILNEKYKSEFLRFIFFIAAMAVSIILKLDYQAFGIAAVLVFYFFYKKSLKMICLYLAGVILYYVSPILANKYMGTSIDVSYLNLIQPISAFSLIFIYFYNGKVGQRAKHLFYIFYPAHLLLLYLIKVYF